MPDHQLQPLTPLGARKPRTDQLPGLRITENFDVALASIACRLGKAADFAAAADRFLGLIMPGPGKVAGKEPYTAIWTGVDQWFLEADIHSHEDIASIVKGGFGETASVTEQTDGWVRFDIAGPNAAVLFEKLCPLDIQTMESNTASRAMIEHMGSIVICRETRARYSILGPRSFAVSLHHALTMAARAIA